MSDYYNGIDRERENKQKLMDRIYDWWESLTEEEQLNIWERENEMTEEDIQGRKDRAIDMQIEEKRLGVME